MCVIRRSARHPALLTWFLLGVDVNGSVVLCE